MIFRAIITKGYQVASGLSDNNQFSAGTIELQKPIFKKLGVDLSSVYNGTLNALIEEIDEVKILKTDYTFEDVGWFKGFTETFNFIKCRVWFKNHVYPGFIYQPDSETKSAHFQPKNMLEILCDYIGAIDYGDSIDIEIPDNYLLFKSNKN